MGEAVAKLECGSWIRKLQNQNCGVELTVDDSSVGV